MAEGLVRRTPQTLGQRRRARTSEGRVRRPSRGRGGGFLAGRGRSAPGASRLPVRLRREAGQGSAAAVRRERVRREAARWSPAALKPAEREAAERRHAGQRSLEPTSVKPKSLAPSALAWTPMEQQRALAPTALEWKPAEWKPVERRARLWTRRALEHSPAGSASPPTPQRPGPARGQASVLAAAPAQTPAAAGLAMAAVADFVPAAAAAGPADVRRNRAARHRRRRRPRQVPRAPAPRRPLALRRRWPATARPVRRPRRCPAPATRAVLGQSVRRQAAARRGRGPR